MEPTDSLSRPLAVRGGDDPLTYRVIGAAIEVHRLLGPGLLESTYEECLCLELLLAGIPFERQMPLPNSIPLKSGIRRLNKSIPSPVSPVSHPMPPGPAPNPERDTKL